MVRVNRKVKKEEKVNMKIFILFGILVDMNALRDKSPDLIKKKKKSVLIANIAIILFGEIPQLIIYATYIIFHIKPAIIPIIVLSSCLIVLIFKLIFNKILIYIFQIIVSLANRIN